MIFFNCPEIQKADTSYNKWFGILNLTGVCVKCKTFSNKCLIKKKTDFTVDLLRRLKLSHSTFDLLKFMN